MLLTDEDFIFTHQTNLDKVVKLMKRTPSVDVVAASIDGVRDDMSELNVDWLMRGTFWFKDKYIKRCRNDNHGTLKLSGPNEDDKCSHVDAVTNFFAARTSKLRSIAWDSRFKMGEHLDFLLRSKGNLNMVMCPSIRVTHYPARTKLYLSRRLRDVHYDDYLKQKSRHLHDKFVHIVFDQQNRECPIKEMKEYRYQILSSYPEMLDSVSQGVTDWTNTKYLPDLMTIIIRAHNYAQGTTLNMYSAIMMLESIAVTYPGVDVIIIVDENSNFNGGLNFDKRLGNVRVIDVSKQTGCIRNTDIENGRTGSYGCDHISAALAMSMTRYFLLLTPNVLMTTDSLLSKGLERLRNANNDLPDVEVMNCFVAFASHPFEDSNRCLLGKTNIWKHSNIDESLRRGTIGDDFNHEFTAVTKVSSVAQSSRTFQLSYGPFYHFFGYFDKTPFSHDMR